MAKTAKPNVAPARPPSPDTAAAAYERVAAEIDALPADRVGIVAVDISTAVSIVLGASVKLAELRPDLSAELTRPPLQSLAKLPDYALAAHYAYLQSFGTSAATADRVRELVAEAAPLRQRLLTVAEMLAALGLIDGARVAEIRSGSGNIDTANDLIALAATFANDWSKIGQQVPIQEAEVDRAAALGTELLVALGVRRVGADREPDAKGWADRKSRALRLMVDAYDEVRRAVAYLRWKHGDADTYAPSLFARRRRAARPSEGEADAPPQPTPAGDETD